MNPMDLHPTSSETDGRVPPWTFSQFASVLGRFLDHTTLPDSTEDSALVEDLDLDSLDAAQIGLFFELLGLEASDTDVNLNRMGDLYALYRDLALTSLWNPVGVEELLE